MLAIRDTGNGSLNMLQTTSCASKVKGVQGLLQRLPQPNGAAASTLTAVPGDLETLASRIKDSVLLVISK
jgi:hypothetical protein